MSETFTIGQVVKRLSAAYPDLTVSKVRFLESEGLVSPARTKGGYRAYSEHDVERLEKILRLQKTCFYPLSVIKERLDAPEEEAAAAERPADEQQPDQTARAVDEEAAALAAVDHVLDELPDLIGVPVPFVRTLQEMGFLQFKRSPEGRTLLDGQDVALVRAAYELKRYGIDPRLLKPHIQRANRDVPMMKQVLSATIGRQGSLDDPKTLQVFDAELERLLELGDTVADSLIRREVRREFKHPASQR